MILQEFYQVVFCKKVYYFIEELQVDLDEWLYYYNYECMYQGKMCCGRIFIEIMIDGKKIWWEKFVN